MGQALTSPVTSSVVERQGSSLARVGVATMQGWRVEHEDTHSVKCAWRKLRDGGKGEHLVGHFAVMDGHGGSAIAKFIAKEFASHQEALPLPPSNSDIQQSFMQLDAKARAVLGNDSSGCTCVSAIVYPDPASPDTFVVRVANIGDSRAVLVRANGTFEASEDHKPSNPEEKERIVNAGGFVSNTMPPRVDGVLALSRAFGDWGSKNNDAIPAEDQKVTALPDVYTWRAKKGDVLVLACDGIYDEMSNAEVVQFVKSEVFGKDDLGRVASELLHHCLKKGSQDNMSAMLIQFRDSSNYEHTTELLLGGSEEEEAPQVQEKYVAFAADHGFRNPKACSTCQRYFKDIKDCPCKLVSYCGRVCQQADWKAHKKQHAEVVKPREPSHVQADPTPPHAGPNNGDGDGGEGDSNKKAQPRPHKSKVQGKKKGSKKGKKK